MYANILQYNITESLIFQSKNEYQANKKLRKKTVFKISFAKMW